MSEWTPPGGGESGEGEPAATGRPRLRADGGDRLFAATPDPALVYSLRDGRAAVERVNDAYAGALGASLAPEDGLEERLRSDLGVGPVEEDGEDVVRLDPLVELVEAAKAGDRLRTIVEAGGGPEGDDYLARVVPVDGEGEPDGYVVLTDITPLRDRARELAEQRDRLDEFASIVSHDLRNPLEVAKIQLEAAQRRGDDEHFEKAADAHERMEQIIADVLTLARQGRVIDEVDHVRLGDVAREAWDSVAAPEASLTVARDATIEADHDRLQEAFENLFRNAHEHVGPEVRVEVGATDGGFYVADDGPGIPPDERERVFEADFSTRTEGTGLGLVIVERIADAHGWSVRATEAETGGARFEFEGVQFSD